MRAAIEVVDSIKRLVESLVSRIPVIKDLKKKSVERGMHVINEIAKIRLSRPLGDLFRCTAGILPAFLALPVLTWDHGLRLRMI